MLSVHPQIRVIQPINLIGKRINTSFSIDKTRELWQGFMPRRNEIKNTISQDLYSVQVFKGNFDPVNFTPDLVYEKWAALQVQDFNNVPMGMEKHIIAEGKYAVFVYKGTVMDFGETAKYFYGSWLPQSGFQLAARDHFEILGKNYLGPNNPESEEEIWIPVQ